MRKKISVLAIALTAPLLTQCASQDKVNQLEYELRMVNRKVQEMETQTVDQIQKRQAASSGQIDQLQSEILTLQSQLEETHHINRRLKEQNKELETQFKSYAEIESQKREDELKRIQDEQRRKEQALRELNEKLRVQQENVKAIQQARVREAERRADAAKRAADLAKKKAAAASKAGIKYIGADKKKVKFKVSSKPASTSTSSTKSVATKPTTTKIAPKTTASSSQTTRADSLYQKGDYQGAYAIYKSQVENAKNENDATSARFMMGECLFHQQQFDQAILQYQKIISINSTHPKAPTALLRQAEAFEKLKDTETSKLIYRKLISSYSDSAEAAKAQAKLDKL